jgi:hypothetical protein
VRLRFALAGLVVLSASLAACTSGTSCGFGCPPTSGPSPTPAPYSLAGTETQDFTYDYGYPSPEPPATITTQISQTVTVSPTALASPFPGGSANDVHVDETDVIDGLQTVKSTTDAYTATSGSQTLLYGSVLNVPGTENGQSTVATYVYDKPQIVDESGEGKWTNSPGAQLSEVYGDGHTQDRTIANDGTYDEVGTVQSPTGSGFVPIHLNEKSDGSGQYSGPFLYNPFLGYTNIDFRVAAPSGNPATVSATYQIKGQPKKPFFTVPAWYASKPTFFTETDRSGGGSAKCAAAATHVAKQSIARLDTIIGYTERSERDTYSNAGGVLCVVFTDTLDNFYDWNGDTTSFIYVSRNAKKISQVVTSETLTAASGGSARRANGVRSAAIPLAAIAALQERFNAKIEATKRALRDRSKRGVR